MSRERAIAKVLFSFHDRRELHGLDIHEAAPTASGLSRWLRENCRYYVISGYFPDAPFGSIVGPLRNENLEHQTFKDGTFDLVLHLVEWAAQRIAEMSRAKGSGVTELAGRGYVTLREIADAIGSSSEFRRGEAFDAEDQYLADAPAHYPAARRVIDWLVPAEVAAS